MSHQMFATKEAFRCVSAIPHFLAPAALNDPLARARIVQVPLNVVLLVLHAAQRSSSAAPNCAQRNEGMHAEGGHVGWSAGLGVFGVTSCTIGDKPKKSQHHERG